MSYLSSLFESPQKQKKKKGLLPPVQSMLNLSSDHFNSDVFYGHGQGNGQNISSFVCEESLQESPSTSNSFNPLREIQPRASTSTTSSSRSRQGLHHVHSVPSSVSDHSSFHHYQYSQHQNHYQPHLDELQEKNDSYFTSYEGIQQSRKRKLIEATLGRPQKQYVCAKLDRLFLLDDQNFLNLYASQDDYLPDLAAMQAIQTECSLDLRKSAVQWLDDVCRTNECDAVIFPLAINFLDRYLSADFVPRHKLQALASACLLLAGKMKAPIPLTVPIIADYTDGAVSEEDLIRWEVLVISTLNWQFCCPTAFEFLDQFLTRSAEFQELREPFRDICYKLQQDATLAALKPSLQAIICAGYAAVEHRDDKHVLNHDLYDAVVYLAEELLEFPPKALWTGVNHLAKLFDVHEIYSTFDSSCPDSEAEDSDDGFLIAGDDEGSPRKIRRISEEPETSPQHEEEEDEIQKLSISSHQERRNKYLDAHGQNLTSSFTSLSRSKSAVLRIQQQPKHVALSKKSLSTTSLRRSSVSDDSGVYSEINSSGSSMATVFSHTRAAASFEAEIGSHFTLKSPRKLKTQRKNKTLQKSDRFLKNYIN